MELGRPGRWGYPGKSVWVLVAPTPFSPAHPWVSSLGAFHCLLEATLPALCSHPPESVWWADVGTSGGVMASL